MIYLSIIFTLLFVYYSKYQFKDLKTIRNVKWKTFGFFMRLFLFCLCYLVQLHSSHWSDYILAGAVNIFLWELLINVIALENKKGAFWAGNSGKLDIFFGKKKWYIMAALILIAVIIKILVYEK